MSAQRIRWKFISASEVLMDNGETLDLAMDSPAFVSQMVAEAVRRFISKEIDECFPTLK